jgi:hypothetical protein
MVKMARKRKEKYLQQREFLVVAIFSNFYHTDL